MNILFCYQNGFYPENGGVQRYCFVLADHLKMYGHNVFFLSLINDIEFQKISAENYYHLPDKSGLYNESNKKFYLSLLQKLKIHTIINNEAANNRFKFFNSTKEIKVNHIALFHTNPIFNLKLGGNPFGVVNNFRFFLINHLKKLRRRNMVANLVSKSDRVVFLSERYVLDMQISLQITSKKITSISNFIEIPTNTTFSTKENKVLFVGRLDDVKQVDLLLQAWKKIATEFEDWTLTIVGTGPNENAYKELIKTKLIKRVTFVGKTDPTPFYQKAKIICLPSKYEGFGLVLAEAMSFGVVPIAFNNWLSLHDIIDDGKSGIIINNKTINGLENTLKLLIDKKNTLNVMSINSFEKSKCFDINNIGKEWLQLLNSL
jgi:glycosyltransferase involved in cell wall biosynthesis